MRFPLFLLKSAAGFLHPGNSKRVLVCNALKKTKCFSEIQALSGGSALFIRKRLLEHCHIFHPAVKKAILRTKSRSDTSVSLLRLRFDDPFLSYFETSEAFQDWVEVYSSLRHSGSHYSVMRYVQDSVLLSNFFF